MTPVILASGSPRRKALLEALGIAVKVIPSGAQERVLDTPEDTVVHNARLKRDAVAKTLGEPALVIGADTTVVLDNRSIGKPRDLDAARETLAALSGRTHHVLTGVAVTDTGSGRTAEGFEKTEVTFRDLSSDEIDRFIDAVRPTDRAGAYTSDGPGTLLIQGYHGCYQNVLGLPVVRLDTLLRGIGDGLFARMDPANTQFL